MVEIIIIAGWCINDIDGVTFLQFRIRYIQINTLINSMCK